MLGSNDGKEDKGLEDEQKHGASDHTYSIEFLGRTACDDAVNSNKDGKQWKNPQNGDESRQWDGMLDRSVTRGDTPYRSYNRIGSTRTIVARIQGSCGGDRCTFRVEYVSSYLARLPSSPAMRPWYAKNRQTRVFFSV